MHSMPKRASMPFSQFDLIYIILFKKYKVVKYWVYSTSTEETFICMTELRSETVENR